MSEQQGNTDHLLVSLGPEIEYDGNVSHMYALGCLRDCGILQKASEEWRTAILQHTATETQVWCTGPKRTCGIATESVKQALAATVSLLPEAIDITQEMDQTNP